MDPILIYFSPCGETKKVNDYYKKYFKNASVFNISDYRSRQLFNFRRFDLVILSFPVYAHNVPKLLIDFLKKLKGSYAVINVCYGHIAPGTALKNTMKILKKQDFKIIAAAMIPTKHCYLEKNALQLNLKSLYEIINKVEKQDCSQIIIPRQKKHILSNFFPTLRHRIAVKKPNINFEDCNKCGVCNKNCPANAITDNYKIINNLCIRCLGCIANCPQKAITTKINPLLTKYLNRHYNKNAEIKIYK